MTVRHLTIFITVAECGKMRKAAELLYISQPSVSQAVAELERHYGVKLFDRLSQKLYLTESGSQLLEHARHIVSAFEDMDLAMKYAGSMPRIRLGGSVSVGTRYFEQIMSGMEREMPEVDLRVTINNTQTIEKMIISSQLDIGIVEGIVEGKEIKKVPLFQDELVVVVGKDHVFNRKQSIQVEDLETQNYFAREDGSTGRNQYEKQLLERGIRLQQKWSCTNTEPIKKAVIAGKGFAIMSTLLVQQEIAEGSLLIVPVENMEVKREIILIYHKDKYLSPQLEAFLTLANTLS